MLQVDKQELTSTVSGKGQGDSSFNPKNIGTVDPSTPPLLGPAEKQRYWKTAVKGVIYKV